MRGRQPTLPTATLQATGQSLWLDALSRDLLDTGWLEHDIDTLAVSGLCAHPTHFAHAIGRGHAYDAALLQGGARGLSEEALFQEVALEDATRAADLLRPIHTHTWGREGLVSLGIPPRLGTRPAEALEQALTLFEQAGRPNLLVQLPGTQQGLRAIEEAIFVGVPLQVTLLYSASQCLAAADAVLRGLERRLEAGDTSGVLCVLSVCVGIWDRAVAGRVPQRLRHRLGVAMAQRTWGAYNALAVSDRAVRLAERGAHLPRLAWTSLHPRSAAVDDTHYVESLGAPDTILLLPEDTLRAFADHGRVGRPMPRDGGDCEQVLADFAAAGVDLDALASRLQEEGLAQLLRAWHDVLACIRQRTAGLEGPGAGAP